MEFQTIPRNCVSSGKPLQYQLGSLSFDEFIFLNNTDKMALNFRLFNCDRTFSLDKVEVLIQRVAAKLSREFNIEKTYFLLPRMKELCEELEKESSHFDYAVLVVHAHESQLWINKDGSEGYSKLYRTLQRVTGDRVLIVIGGDDNYKDQAERDKSLLSRWAWHKIFSQFTEDYFNGVKSFIFSWEENHHPIHEEALEFYLDPAKKGTQFVPRPRPRPVLKVPEKKETTNTEQAKTLQMKRLQEQERQAAEGRIRLEKEMLKHDPLLSDVRKQEPEPMETRKFLEKEFPPERNEGRSLPSGPGTSTHPLQKENQMESQADQHQAKQASAKRGTPDVHILSFHASQPSVDQVENLFKDVYKELAIQAKPKSSAGVQTNIQEYIMKYKPEYLVLVSEMEDIEDMKSIGNQVQRYKDIVNKSCSVGTKLIFIVTEDKNYIEGYLSSDTVHSMFTRLNQGILCSDQPMVMSWNKTPWPKPHRDALSQLLTPHGKVQRRAPQQYEATKQHPTSGVPYSKPEDVPMKKRGFYRASISYGRVVQVLMSDPPDWEPDTRYLNDMLMKHRSVKKAIIEFWDEGDGRGLQSVVHPSEATFSKITEGNASEEAHSILVYSYHDEEKTNDMVTNFLHHLGVSVLSLCQPIEPLSLMADIMSVKPDYVMFSVDADVMENTDEAEKWLRKHVTNIKNILENNVRDGVIIMLFGDKYYTEQGEMASREVTRHVTQLTQGIVHPDRLTVMTCKDRPYSTHQDLMKELLTLKKSFEAQRDPEKGILRYKADFVFGEVIKVSYRFPREWQPEESILKEMLEIIKTEEKATLEFWEDNGKIKPIVTTPSKNRFFRLPSFSFPSLPSFPSSPNPFSSNKKKNSDQSNIV